MLEILMAWTLPRPTGRVGYYAGGSCPAFSPMKLRYRPNLSKREDGPRKADFVGATASRCPQRCPIPNRLPCRPH